MDEDRSLADLRKRLDELHRNFPFISEWRQKHPIGEYEKVSLEELEAVQKPMLEWASHFLESQRDHLRAVIRLTMEFFNFMQRVDIDSVDPELVFYLDLSIFAGVDSFLSVCGAYSSTVGATPSELPQRVESRAVLQEQYMDMYQKFSAEPNFENKCRLMLDIYKLQIVFEGLTYDR